MASRPPPSPRGPNPLAHLMGRQSGDNVVNFRKNLFRERMNIAKNLYRKDLVSHFGCVNAIEFSNEGELLISGGDDRRVLLWRLEDAMAGKSKPRAMAKQHQSNIFCLGFNSDNSKIFSGGNDDTVNVHDVKTGESADGFAHAKPVYGLSIDPTNDNVFSTAGEDGRVLVFDLRKGTEVLALPKYRASFHAVQFHPLDGNFAITANGKEGAAFWDLRHTKMPSVRYGGDDAAQSCMSVRFNTLGTQVLALRRRLPPILYNTCSQVPICQFYHPDYYNSCTMKSCCFGGENDEFVLSGSDDFNLYVWRVAEADCNGTYQWVDDHQMVLYGHRSIVNQVRFNPQKCVIASSGVEKMVKLWHPFAIDGWTGTLSSEEVSGCENSRNVFSYEEYLSLMNSSGQNMTHDYSNQNTTEDPRMMAFFDSLVQREIEGWNSNDNSESDRSSQHSSDGSSRPTSTESSGSETVSNYITTNVEPCRRGRLVMKPRTVYANRIAYLIATKRNTLKRLALKGAAHTERRVRVSKIGNRTMTHVRLTRKGNGKRAGRTSVSKRNVVSHEDIENSGTDVPKKKRRIQQHLNTSTYRTFRRKSKTVNTNRRFESPDTSSEDNEASTSTDNHRNLPSTSAAVVTTTTAVIATPSSSTSKYALSKYLNLTAQCASPATSSEDDNNDDDDGEDDDVDDDDDDDDIDHNAAGASQPSASTNTRSIKPIANGASANDLSSSTALFPTNIAVPSTSTGITANGLLFRIAPPAVDSDDDPTPPNSGTESEPVALVRVIPMPINGTHNFEAAAYSSGIDDEHPNEDRHRHHYHHQVRRKRNVSSMPANGTGYAHYSSHSNSRLSSSCSQEEDASSRDSLTPFYQSAPTALSDLEDVVAATSPSARNTNNIVVDAKTPGTSRSSASLSRRHMLDFTPDSGIAMSAHGSSSSANCDQHPSSGGSASNHHSSVYNNNNNNNNNIASNTQDGNNNTNGGIGGTGESVKLFQQKVARIRRNYRYDFGDDSDSD